MGQEMAKKAEEVEEEPSMAFTMTLSLKWKWARKAQSRSLDTTAVKIHMLPRRDSSTNTNSIRTSWIKLQHSSSRTSVLTTDLWRRQRQLRILLPVAKGTYQEHHQQQTREHHQQQMVVRLLLADIVAVPQPQHLPLERQQRKKHLPASKPIVYSATDQKDKIVAKLKANNAEAKEDGNQLSDEALDILAGPIVDILCSSSKSILSDDQSLLLAQALNWRLDLLVPVLDLARLAIATEQNAVKLLENTDSFEKVLKTVHTENATPPILILACRFLCNLAASTPGIEKVSYAATDILNAAQSTCAKSSNRRVRETYASLLLNYALSSKIDSSSNPALQAGVNLIVSGEEDEEVLYRALVAVGTIMTRSEGAVTDARECGVAEAATAAAPVSSRLTAVANEIAQLLFQ
mmetsp:Transcript_3897/g.11653  ORF Transcript_3897/g.11653 Transcript_3897/m.11653 type:complete len:406 (+) Transcript_3897:1246-2463(+)